MSTGNGIVQWILLSNDRLGAWQHCHLRPLLHGIPVSEFSMRFSCMAVHIPSKNRNEEKKTNKNSNNGLLHTARKVHSFYGRVVCAWNKMERIIRVECTYISCTHTHTHSHACSSTTMFSSYTTHTSHHIHPCVNVMKRASITRHFVHNNAENTVARAKQHS